MQCFRVSKTFLMSTFELVDQDRWRIKIISYSLLQVPDTQIKAKENISATRKYLTIDRVGNIIFRTILLFIKEGKGFLWQLSW